MTKYTDEDLIVNEKLREELMDRLDVLETVKEIALLPNTELANTKTLSEWFEVPEVTVKQAYNRNREELERNGAKTVRGQELRDLKTEIQDVTLLGRANAVTVFSTRAILNLAMLLRDSKVAEAVRSNLLDNQELLADEQKVFHLNYEQQLALQVLYGGSPGEKLEAMEKYNEYKNRHIKELEETVEKMKPKEEAFDVFIDAKNFQRMNDVAKSVGYGRNKLFAFLRDKKILMECNTPYQTYIERGWFVVKQRTIMRGDFYRNHAQTFVTAKGTEVIAKMLREEGLID